MKNSSFIAQLLAVPLLVLLPSLVLAGRLRHGGAAAGGAGALRSKHPRHPFSSVAASDMPAWQLAATQGKGAGGNHHHPRGGMTSVNIPTAIPVVRPLQAAELSKLGDLETFTAARESLHPGAKRRELLQSTSRAPPTGSGNGGGGSGNNSTAPDGDPGPSNEDAVNGPASPLLAALLQGYDKSTFPYQSQEGPVVVQLNVALHKIISVNLQEGTMDLNVWLRLNWNDPRLAWNVSQWGGVRQLYVSNQELRYMDIWYPDVTLWNSAYDIATTLGAQAPILYPNGDVYWGRNGLLKVACNFKGLPSYPFGPVKCLMEFGTWSHGPNSVMVVEAPQGGATIAGNSVTDMQGARAVEWRFNKVDAWIHHYPAYPCCPDESNWPVLLVDVQLHRTQTLYILKILVPQVILALVGFMTFWLSPESGERLGVAVTIPLALAVYDLLVYSTLPASDDISCVGAIGLLGFLFSIVTLALNGAVIQLYHYREPEWWLSGSSVWTIWLRYRQQVVWARLLGVLDALEAELVRQHLQQSAEAKKQRRAAARSLEGRRKSLQGRRPSLLQLGRSRKSLDGSPQSPCPPPDRGSGGGGGGGAAGAAAAAMVAVQAAGQLDGAASLPAYWGGAGGATGGGGSSGYGGGGFGGYGGSFAAAGPDSRGGGGGGSMVLRENSSLADSEKG